MDIDVVVIGLNAEKFIKDCLESIYNSQYTKGSLRVFYVDGGSKDSSVYIAKGFAQAQIVELNLQHPTPGIGRNRGYKLGNAPFIQFLDSDTVLDPNWFENAIPHFSADIGAVQGNLQEKYPDHSVYNWIADLEWNAEPGECEFFGGNVLIKREAIDSVAGFDETLVGGEDPDLSVKVHTKGWRIIHLNIPMALHDLNMMTFAQYCKRAYRSGYAYGAIFYRYDKEKWKIEVNRILIRGGGAMALFLIGFVELILGYVSGLFFCFCAVILLLYPRLFSVQNFVEDKNISVNDAKAYSWHCSFVVIPQFFGFLRYCIGKWLGKPLQNQN